MLTKGVGVMMMLLMITAISCGSDAGNSARTTTDSLANDTMPVVFPGNVDTSRVLTPPPTNDDNNAYSDSSQKQ